MIFVLLELVDPVIDFIGNMSIIYEVKYQSKRDDAKIQRHAYTMVKKETYVYMMVWSRSTQHPFAYQAGCTQ